MEGMPCFPLTGRWRQEGCNSDVWKGAGSFAVMWPRAGYPTSLRLSLPAGGETKLCRRLLWSTGQFVAHCLAQSSVVTWTGIRVYGARTLLGSLLIWESGIPFNHLVLPPHHPLSHLHHTLAIVLFYFVWQDAQGQMCGLGIRTTSADGCNAELPLFVSLLWFFFSSSCHSTLLCLVVQAASHPVWIDMGCK